MSQKKIIIDTDRHKGRLFKVSPSGRKLHVYDVEPGWFGSKLRRIGEAADLDDALEIIKTSVEGAIQNIRIQPW